MGLYLALAWTPKFRFQVLHIVEDKEKLSLQHDAETLMVCPSPVTLQDAIARFENEFDMPDDISVVVDTTMVEEIFSLRNFMSYLTLKEAALDVEFRGGEMGVEDPYPLEYQEDEANPHEHDTPDEQVWNPPR